MHRHAGTAARAAGGLLALGMTLSVFHGGPGGGDQAVAGVPQAAPAPAARSEVVGLFVGDSFTAGTGASSPDEGEACLTAKALGWICKLDAQGSTGFLADGSAISPSFAPLAERLQRTHERFLADVVVVDAGRNDGGVRPALRRAVRDYLGQLRDTWPKAAIVVVVPYFLDRDQPLDEPDCPRCTARRPSASVLAWSTPSERVDLPGAVGVAGPAGRCAPEPEGHQYIAEHLAEDLRTLGLDQVAVTDVRPTG